MFSCSGCLVLRAVTMRQSMMGLVAMVFLGHLRNPNLWLITRAGQNIPNCTTLLITTLN